ncbi:MAG: hypothetical protein OHK0024_20370 [Thalassobaculales bacterium]
MNRLVPALAILAPALALHAHKGMAPLFTIAAVAAGALFAWRRQPPAVDRELAVLFAALAAWGLVSALWAIAPGESLDLVYRLALMAAGTLLLLAAAAQAPDGKAAAAADAAILGGMLVGASLLVVEWASGGAIMALVSAKAHPLTALKPGSTVLVLLAWPALLVAWRRLGARGALALLLVLLLPLASLEGRTALLALLIGGAALALAWAAPRAAGLLLGPGVAFGVLAAPLLVALAHPVIGAERLAAMPASGHHRLQIWKFAADHVFQAPLQGWGLNAARSFPGADAVIDAATRHTAMPLHPHNAALQVWLELGLVGAVLFAAILLVIARRIAAIPDRAGRAAAFALLASALTITMLSYGAWQNWWLSAEAIAAVLMAAALARR